jgi:hypothetical protein
MPATIDHDQDISDSNIDELKRLDPPSSQQSKKSTYSKASALDSKRMKPNNSQVSFQKPPMN